MGGIKDVKVERKEYQIDHLHNKETFDIGKYHYWKNQTLFVAY